MAIPTGSPIALADGSTVNTRSALDNSTALANTNYVDTAVAADYPHRVVSLHLTGQSANIATGTVLYTTPAAAGRYRISGYCVCTTKATTSSTLPNILFGYTDADTSFVNGPITMTTSGTQNTVGNANLNQGSTNTFNFYAKASTNITYGVQNYATSGATAMVFAVHIIIEYLGP